MVLVLIGASVVSWPFLSGRALEPALAFEHATSSIDEAKQLGAEEWASQKFTTADSLLQSAAVELVRQKTRLAPLRNFELAGVLLRAARDSAASAADVTRRTKAAVESESHLALDELTQVLLEAEAVRDAHVLDPAARRKLQAARVQAVEAHLRQEEGDFIGARDLAQGATVQALEVLDTAASRTARFVDENELQRWQTWFEETLAESRERKCTAIVVNKERNELVLYDSGREVRRYPAEMGRRALERKLFEGDGATPEGRYRVVKKKQGPDTIYHRALLIDYPTQTDLARLAEAKKRKHVRADARPGGSIEIHGEGGKGWDWTRGCVAMTNRDIDDLWAHVDVNTPVTIVGGDGRDGAFSRVARSTAKRRK
ncbi:MAG: L,D-transpeptidase [Candidatus Eisenbacteria bacterium]